MRRAVPTVRSRLLLLAIVALCTTSSAEPVLTNQTLRAALDQVKASFAAHKPECRGRGVLPSEGLALVAASLAASIDVFIESGTASGVSTEIVAQNFLLKNGLNPRLKIYTIDSDRVGYDAKGGMITKACNRLKKYPNVKCIRGDSFAHIPQILKQVEGKRVGVFLDGPKHGPAAKLCARVLNSSTKPAPIFCAIHDTAHSGEGANRIKPYHVMWQAMKRWDRLMLQTDDSWYRARYAALDHRCNFYSKEKFPGGFGLSIIAGKETMPAEGGLNCRMTGLKICRGRKRNEGGEGGGRAGQGRAGRATTAAEGQHLQAEVKPGGLEAGGAGGSKS